MTESELRPQAEWLAQWAGSAGDVARAWLKEHPPRGGGIINPADVIDLDNQSADYWRGRDDEHGVLCHLVHFIFDGKDDGHGTCREPWEGVRRRLLALVERQADDVIPISTEWLLLCGFREWDAELGFYFDGNVLEITTKGRARIFVHAATVDETILFLPPVANRGDARRLLACLGINQPGKVAT